MDAEGNYRYPGARRDPRPRLRAGALAAGAALALGGGLLAAGPALAQAQPSCGQVLTASVTLTADLDCSTWTTGPALTIAASDVTLNLGGYTITGPGGSSKTAGVQVGTTGTSAQAPASDTVTNGTIADFYYDVDVAAARSLHLTGLDLQFDTPDTYYGVYAEDTLDGGTFSSITAQDAGYGIYLYGTAGVTVTGANLDGSGYGFDGEYNTGDTISHSHASNGGSAVYGFEDEYSQDAFTGDTANGDEYGFYIYGDGYGVPTLKSDTADTNTTDGFYLEYNYNDACYSGRSCPHEVVTGNTADHNGSDGFFDYYSLGATWTGNTASYNGGYGINLEYPGEYTVKYNTADYNTSTGIYLEYNEYGSYYNVKAASYNTAYYNGDYGLYADYAAPGKANTALHNTPYDCFNFVCKAGSQIPRRGTLDRPPAIPAPRPAARH